MVLDNHGSDGTLQLDDVRVQRKFVLIDAVEVTGRHSAVVRIKYLLFECRCESTYLPMTDPTSPTSSIVMSSYLLFED